jgi:hypothetical protein
VTPEPVRQPEQASGVLVTAGARKLCRAVGTTAWAVLADIALDAEADSEGRLVAATNVRRIAADLGISKDTAARALGRLVDAGLVVRHCRRGAARRSLGAPMTSTVLPGFVAVGTGLDQRGAHVSAHSGPSPVATRVTLHRNDALTVQHPELASPPPTDTDDLTTTAPPAPNHVHDELTSTVHNASDDHPKNRFRHWHPAVPFPGAAVTGAAEAAKAAPC